MGAPGSKRPSGSSLLALAKQQADAAARALNALSVSERLEACLELPADLRGHLLELLESPEEVVSRLPETEFLMTLRGSGFEESSWLLAYSTQEQRVACIDIDCWQRSHLELRRFRDWIDALILAGGDALLRSLEEFDPEIWVLAFRDMGRFAIADPTAEPYGFYTEDGVVFYRPNAIGDRERLHHILATLVAENQALYWQLVQGVVHEDAFEAEEFALRWRSGRMADLGFPEFEQAVGAYRPLALEQVDTIEYIPDARLNGALVASAQLPVSVRGSLVARALRVLDPIVARDVFGNVLAVANTLAVADQLDLADPSTIPRSLRKAIRGMDQGLRALATRHQERPSRILETHRPLDLFRIGMSLDRDLNFAPPPEEDLYEELLDLIGIPLDDEDLCGEVEEL